MRVHPKSTELFVRENGETDYSKELAEVLSPYAKQFFNAFLPVVDVVVSTVIPKTLEALSRLPEDWPARFNQLATLSTRSKQAMQLALDRGWFFGWHVSLREVLTLVKAIEDLEPGDLDAYMADYFRQCLNAFACALIEKYPDREKPISAAVHAHQELGDDGYLLSIPVFIAQADGICAEWLGIEQPLSKSKGPGASIRAATHAQQVIQGDSHSAELLHPLFELHNSDFLKGSKQRGAGTFDALNRHQVMHGETSDYGSEVNSLKAFSFLVFVGLHLPSVLERNSASSHP